MGSFVPRCSHLKTEKLDGKNVSIQCKGFGRHGQKW